VASRARNYRAPLKPNPQIVLEYISPEVRSNLIDWLLNQPLSYPQVTAKLKEVHGIEVGTEAIRKFYARHVYPIMLQRRDYEVSVAAQMAAGIKKNPGEFFVTTIDSVQRRMAKLATDEESSVRELKLCLDLIIRWGDQDLRRRKLNIMERQLALYEKRYKAAEEALAKRNHGVDDNAFVERMRKIFKRDQITNHSNGEEKEIVPRSNGFAT
jgi:hypothetical protein